MPETKIPEMKRVRILRKFPENLVSHFAGDVVVQHDPESFILSFFEMWPPLIIGDTDEEKLKIINSIDHVDATCVARIVLKPSKMLEVIKAIEENIATYEKMMSEIKKKE